MLVNSTGFVIKTTKYSETSVITKIFTHQHGMLSFHIPGVYSKKGSIKASYLQVMQKVALSYYFRENKNLKKVKSLQVDTIRHNNYTSVKHSSLLMVISELLHKCIREEEANTELFSFIDRILKQLDGFADFSPVFLSVFMLKLSTFLGFYPSGRYSPQNPYFLLDEGCFAGDPGASKYFTTPYFGRLFGLILDCDMPPDFNVKISPDERFELLKTLELYYKIHVPGFNSLNSLDVIREVYKAE